MIGKTRARAPNKNTNKNKKKPVRPYGTCPCSSFGTRSACTTSCRRAGCTDAPVHTRRPRRRPQLACTVYGNEWFGAWQESYMNRLADRHLDAQLQSETGEV